MLGPEGTQLNSITTEEDLKCKKSKLPSEGASHFTIGALGNPNRWRKSITKFFRNQLRSTKSNDGDCVSESNANFEQKEMNTEQKWQSLGKVFRRQSFVDSKQTSPHEETSQHKRLAVRKVLSSYFGRANSPNPAPDSKK